MTREEAIEMLKSKLDGSVDTSYEWAETVRMAIEALSEPSGETVSKGVYLQTKWERDTALHTLEEHGIGLGQKADRPTGEWLEVEVFPEVYDIEGVKTWGSEMQCDQCGFRHTAIEGRMAQYNFCPNCGARMKGGAE